MNVLIIEDEALAASQLAEMLLELIPDARVAGVIDGIDGAVDFLQSNNQLDLILLDIYLTDGLSFEIFDAVCVDIPVIFTTAYNEYAIKAFELNSIDYLLKPVRKERLQRALEKLQRLQTPQQTMERLIIKKVADLLHAQRPRKRSFLIPFRDRLIPVAAADFGWFTAESGVVLGMRFDGTQVTMEERSLEELSEVLDPELFFRINRQYIVNRNAVKHLSFFFNGRWTAEVDPPVNGRLVVSKVKAGSLKQWLRQ